MGQFAPVCPPQMLVQLASKKRLGNYHLLLAHDVVEYAVDYRLVFYPQRDSFTFNVHAEDMTIFMDNSVIELGKPINMDMMREARRVIPHSVLVLPDVIGDGEATLRMVSEFGKKGINDPLLHPPFMAVPQGNNLAQFLENVRCLRYHSGVPIAWWGVPRHAVASLGTRHELLTRMHDIDPTIKIHLLGFSDNIMDDISCARRREVKGIDSAVPIRMGMRNVRIQLDPDWMAPPRGTYWEDARTYSITQEGCVMENLEVVRSWLNA